jgi:hypothetical protein
MRGDASTHGSGTEYNGFFDCALHGGLWRRIGTKAQVTKPAWRGQTRAGGAAKRALKWE